ncbi:GNAT family N-acetyltransferase [Candidatus Roizmanbacteria bacterium]|nr:GNAT family N-acetyltransferase [Candidatus Roizmanbacteria bacterium]
MDIVIHDGSEVAGSAHIVLSDDLTAKIESFTVFPEYRGKKVGRSLMEKIESYLKEKSAKKSIIDSPKFIKGFYEKFGYVQEGLEFMVNEVPTIKMVKHY